MSAKEKESTVEAIEENVGIDVEETTVLDEDAQKGLGKGKKIVLTKRNKILILVIGVVAVLLLVFAATCASNNVEAGASPDAPPVMKAGHNTRYVELGAAGCYGCHGNNSDGKTMLKAATPLPEDHYKGKTGTSVEDLAGEHTTCNTCHVPGE